MSENETVNAALAGEKHSKPSSEVEQPKGDFGGEFGYGYPAHKPDPAATYGFEQKPTRVLPVNPRARWR